MKWRTKDGLMLEVQEMETSHIINCIKLIRRRIYKTNVPIFCVEAVYRAMIEHAKQSLGLKEELKKRNVIYTEDEGWEERRIESAQEYLDEFLEEMEDDE